MPKRNLIAIVIAAIVSLLCYERAARNRYVGTLTEAMNYIDANYVDPVNDRELFEGAMEGMLNKLDPYSSYTNPKGYRQFQESLDQRFGGIGILVEVDPETKRLTVMNPLLGTPAYKAGIKSGDVILKIGDHDTKDMPLDKSVTLMRGPEGSPITVTLQQANAEEPYVLTLQRAKIPIESVLGDTRDADGVWDFHLHDDRPIGLLRLTSFGEQSTAEFAKALESFQQPGQEIRGLIIDVRANPGGLLSAARDISDMFLDDGVIVSTRGRGEVVTSVYRAEPGVLLDRTIPMVVLVDRFTASASEILAACLQDHGRAVVCGERTWGKGTVQNVKPLGGGNGAMRLTTATYWRPSEKNIHKRKDAKETDDWGVRPNEGMQVELTDEEREKLGKARRDRDLAPLRKVNQPAPPKPPPRATEDESTKSVLEKSDALPTPEIQDDPTTSPGAAPAGDEQFEDPQLRKAIEYLLEKMKTTPAASVQ